MNTSPVVDIVMLIHDSWSWADLAVRAVEHHTKNPFRLILVDMASQEQRTKDGLREAEARGHTVVRLGENRSFSNGVNAGVARGDSRYICVLNDDALVTEGWDSHLLQDASAPRTGMVGARSNLASGPMGDPSWVGAPKFLVFVCVALRREVWNKIGPMDEETFDGFSAEDLDYSFRVRKAGYDLKVSNAYVLHAGSRTLIAKLGAPSALAANNAKYLQRLHDKWTKEYVQDAVKSKLRVLVNSYHAETWTRVEFMRSMIGTKSTDGYTYSFNSVSRMPIHQARFAVCEMALRDGYDVLIQLDDDATFPTDLIRRLLSHEKEVVTALAYARKPPHMPCIFELDPDTLLGRPLDGYEHTGLRRVDASGFHCSAIRTSVIKKLHDYREKSADGIEKYPKGAEQYFGEFDGKKAGEDFKFSWWLKRIGVAIYCDTGLISGHIGDEIIVDENYKKAFDAGQRRG